MANGASIDAVYTIANISRPIDHVNGRVLASTVHSLSNSKKRKRSHVAVSVDGEGVNIYSVKSRRVLSSYPVPPHTYFVTRPCSLQQEASKDRPACRFTYSATKTSSTDSKTHVLCLEEQVHQADPANPKRNEQTLPGTTSVVWIDTLPAYNIAQSLSANHDVLVLQEKGQLTSFSERLEEKLWTSDLGSIAFSADDSTSGPQNDFKVQHAELVDLETAKQGLLKGREDVLAALSIPGVVPELHTQSELLVVITKDAAGSKIHIFALRSRTSSHSTGQRAQPQHLLTWGLPAVTGSDGTVSYSLNAGSGILYQLDNGKILTYDLSGISPRIANSLNTEQNVQSIVPLSSALLLASSLQNYTIYDIKYGSIQATAPISEPTQAETLSKKRRVSGSKAKPSSAHLIGYYAKSGIAAVLSGQNLIAVQVGGRSNNSKRRRLADPLLIDSIGKAVGSSLEYQRFSKFDLPAVLGKCLKDNATNPNQHQKFSRETITTLDELVAKDDIRAFESLFAAEVKVKTNLDNISHKREKQIAKHGEDDLEWIFPTDKKLPLFREKAMYALSRVFSWNPTTNGLSSSDKVHSKTPAVTIKFLPPNLFQWLAITGQFTADLIQQALQAISPHENSVARGDVVLALANFDPSLAHLHTLLTYYPRLEIEEVVNAIKLIILSLDDATLPQPEPVISITNGDLSNGYKPINALTNGDHRLTNGDVPMTNGDESKSDEAESEDALADAAMEDVEDELERVIDTLEKPIRGDSLRQAITKLDSFSPNIITSTLREQLSHHEIVFFIHILRIELADGGWTTRYLDDGPDDNDESDEFWDRAIGVIAKALSCAVDALGMSGWLLSSAADPMDAVDKLLDSLRAEISATLEGVHEATFLTGVLSEFMRYQNKRINAGYKPFSVVPNAGRRNANKEGRVWRHEAGEDKVLPVGLKVLPKSVEGVVKIGGKMERRITKREEGIKRSKMVGVYSFEQIRF
ncbi:hypothetical protein EG328_008107 [Venturia inaequalis]|uniref:Utp8 beta-propeller domain-containing protein n=1 Tax=Venturia inaequalis TaxID=5025 RepID=A0A8H3Z4C3_VENIN|nr:hypothetical protein EG328_008107 [Venturia inaequalis]RDI87943.1 hypothetical protein Vi05172_g1733 [Venturia inaequalis]